MPRGMAWEPFFAHHIDGYLLSDLREMDRISVEGAGNCGYPMLMAILSGMELLGGLSCDEERWIDSSGKSEHYFKHFFTTYFQKQDKSYRGKWSKFYKLLRHKLAHSYMTSLRYQIVKNKLDVPLVEVEGFTILDVSIIYRQFEQAILELKDTLSDTPELSERFVGHLDDMYQAYGPLPARRSGAVFTTASGVVNNYSSNASIAYPVGELPIISTSDD